MSFSAGGVMRERVNFELVPSRPDSDLATNLPDT